MRIPVPQPATPERALGTAHFNHVQRKYGISPIQRKPWVSRMTPGLQTQMEEKEEGLFQTKQDFGRLSKANPKLTARIRSLRGGGQPLSETSRSFFEPRFETDCSQVRGFRLNHVVLTQSAVSMVECFPD
ncbi:MAG: hypothetical protein ACE5GK_12760 [Nitrospiria bacterium]